MAIAPLLDNSTVDRASIIPGADPDAFIYVQDSVHRNLFRVTLP